MDLGIDDIVQSAVRDLFDDLTSTAEDSDPRLPYVVQARPGGSQSWQVQQSRAAGPSTTFTSSPSQRSAASASDEQSGALSDDEDDLEAAPRKPKKDVDPPPSTSTSPAAEDDAGLSVSPAHVALGSLQLSITARHGSSSAAAATTTARPAPNPATAAAAEDDDSASKAAKTAGLLASLQADKSRLKKHLRAEDEKFEREHHRKPGRADKEHLRPMYERYRVLKREIEELVAASKPATAAGGAAAPAAKAAAAPKGPKPGSLDALRTEKRTLQIQLRRFEEDFRRANGRAVQFHRDIKPVEGDYRRYKDLKKRIAKLERDKT